MATAFSLTYSTHGLDKPILQALDSTGLAAPAHPVGYTVRHEDGRAWEYVWFISSDVAAVAGAPACWAATTVNKAVTADISDSSGATSGEGCAGVFMSVLTDLYYGWIQKKGKVFAKVSSTCAIGSAITVMDNGAFSTLSGLTGIPIGTALEAGTVSETSAPFIEVMLLDH